MPPIPRMIRAVTVLTLAAACGCTTTPEVRQRAADTSARVAAYRKQQQDRIDHLNESYRDAFARQMDELITLSDQSLTAGRNLDAQRIADEMIVDGSVTLPSRMYDLFLKLINDQRQRIQDADNQVATARARYVAAYHQASLELTRLDHIKANLDRLATPENQADVVDQLIGELGTVYKELKDASDKSAGKQPTGGAIPQPKAKGHKTRAS